MICKLCKKDIHVYLIVDGIKFCPHCQDKEAMNYVNRYNNKSWLGRQIEDVKQMFKKKGV